MTELTGSQDSDFDLRVIRAPRTKSEDILLMDLQERAIVINLSHESAADKISVASKDWMFHLVSQAIVEASYPELSRGERNMLFGEMFID